MTIDRTDPDLRSAKEEVLLIETGSNIVQGLNNFLRTPLQKWLHGITSPSPPSPSLFNKTMTAFSHSSNSMQVTISLLPVSLSLVHIPRPRLAQLSHPVLSQILQPSPTFLNITCNEIELSLFAEHHVLADFERIARDDRRRQRSRSGSGSSRKNISRNFVEPVEISYEQWNVLQIDSHSDQLGMSSWEVGPSSLSADLCHTR